MVFWRSCATAYFDAPFPSYVNILPEIACDNTLFAPIFLASVFISDVICGFANAEEMRFCIIPSLLERPPKLEIKFDVCES